MSGRRPQNSSDGGLSMKNTEHRQMATELLDLIRQMEQVLKDYCRQLTAHDDGHQLESENNDEPF
jgi:hypothetical protein